MNLFGVEKVSKFEIDTKLCKQVDSELDILATSLEGLKSRINVVSKSLKSIDFCYVNSNLKNEYNSIGSVISKIKGMHKALDSVIRTYESTEKQLLMIGSLNDKDSVYENPQKLIDSNITTPKELLDFVFDFKDQLDITLLSYLLHTFNSFFNFADDREYSVNSIVFDSEGSYGGNQGSMEEEYNWNPIKCWDLLMQLKKYYPNINIFEAFNYFSHLNSNGCGYVALANILFMEYEGKEKEFEKTFGFPMYDGKDLNYDRLILDIYATTDILNINDGDDGLPLGTLDETRADILSEFLKDKGMSITTESNAEITQNNFKSIVERDGKVIVGFRNGNIYDSNGNAHYIDGGHAMTVTGVTKDGRYIVSSWGKKYYININDIDEDDSFMIFYFNK